MTLHYFDVSHYQGDYHPTGPTAAKATEGTGYTDARYATTRARTLAGGWPFVGYHFLSTQDTDAQVKHAHAVIGQTPAMLDVESGTTGDPSWSQIKAFIAGYRAAGGIMHVAYIPEWYWQRIGHPSMQWLDDNQVALISSNYRPYSDTGAGWAAYGNVTPTIWQHTSTPLDENAFRGTADELRNVFETGETTVALTADDKAWIAAAIASNNNDAANAVWHAAQLADTAGKSAAVSAANALEVTRNQVLTPATTTPAPRAALGPADYAAIAVAVLDEQHRRDAA